MSQKPTRERFIFIDDLRNYPELAQALGDMVVAWSNAERAILDTLQEALGISSQAAHAMYFRIPTFESRVKVLQAILAQWKPDYSSDPEVVCPQDPKELSHIVGKLSRLSVTRNGWIHGRWAFSTRNGSLAIIDYREEPGSPAHRRPVKAADIRNHVAAVHKWATLLQNVNRAVRVRIDREPEPRKPLKIEQPPR